MATINNSRDLSTASQNERWVGRANWKARERREALCDQEAMFTIRERGEDQGKGSRIEKKILLK